VRAYLGSIVGAVIGLFIVLAVAGAVMKKPRRRSRAPAS
jgi:hypothetical protein